MNQAGVFVGGKIDSPVADDERLFQFGEQKHTAAWRIQRCRKQSMVAARVGPSNSAAGKSTQPVGLKPFTAKTGFQISAHAFIETNHVHPFRLERRDFGGPCWPGGDLSSLLNASG